jgi:hypothetical protein
MYLRARFSVSSSSFLVFSEVLLEAALFVPAVAAKYKEITVRIKILKRYQQRAKNTR